MSKEMTVIVLGIWLIAVPYLGVPGSWRTVIVIGTGIIVAGVGFFLRAEAIGRSGARHQHRTFVENLPTGQAGADMAASESMMHDHKERITSLN
ncbi:MAG TPA: hypothetical protein VHD31_03575 [Candidatus Paceibacterota bacterium]|nr:hypothetical protein [Candidatus Paceibacterota bacterium]